MKTRLPLGCHAAAARVMVLEWHVVATSPQRRECTEISMNVRMWCTMCDGMCPTCTCVCRVPGIPGVESVFSLYAHFEQSCTIRVINRINHEDTSKIYKA